MRKKWTPGARYFANLLVLAHELGSVAFRKREHWRFNYSDPGWEQIHPRPRRIDTSQVNPFAPPPKRSLVPKAASYGELTQRFLTRSQFFNMVDALIYANCRGAILDNFVTIRWDQAAVFLEKDVSEHFGNFWDAMSRWSKRRGGPFAIYCHENGRRVGVHTHLMAHVAQEDQNAFDRQCSNWLRTSLCIRTLPDGLIKRTPQYRRELHPIQPLWQLGRLLYLSKSIHPTAEFVAPPQNELVKIADYFGMELEESLPLEMKRCGVSRNIDRGARETNNYLPITHEYPGKFQFMGNDTYYELPWDGLRL